MTEIEKLMSCTASSSLAAECSSQLWSTPMSISSAMNSGIEHAMKETP